MKTFGRWLKETQLTDEDLTTAIENAENGTVAAQLGGGLVKLRIARKGGGKSGGFRMVVACQIGGHSFFLEGFAKNEKDNISPDDLHRLKILGSALRSLDEKGLERAIAAGVLRELRRP